MIYLVTAVPGSGKTLYVLDWLRRKSDEECRQVYYHNIPLSAKGKELLQWIELPNPADWFKLPPGAIFVCDECQYPFPVRKSGNSTPEHVEKMTTHRHLGLDLVLITQHPNLVDSFIRRLVGTHRHLIRQFGAERSTLLTWQEGVQDNPNAKSAQKACLDKRTFSFPKEVYSWYKSAEVHTHKFQMPQSLKRMIIYLILSFIAIGFSAYYIYHGMYAKPKADAEALSKTNSSQPAQSILNPQSDSARQGNSKPIKTANTFLGDRQPRVQGVPDSAPAYDDLTTVKAFPKVSACMATQSKCSCYTQQGTIIEMDDYRCRFYVNRGWFDPYVQPIEAREEIREARRLDAAEKVVSSAPAMSRRGPVVLSMTNSDVTPHLEGRK